MILYLLFLFCFSFTQGLGVVDGVLVIVEDNVILRSDIEEQVFLLAKEGGVSPQKTPLAFESLYKKVIDEYSQSKFTPEALHRLVEIYYTLGMIDDAKKAAATLGHNYPDSKWYERSYEIVGEKKDKKSFLEKFF